MKSNKEIIELLENASCAGCIYANEASYSYQSPLKCVSNDCEYKNALKAAVKQLRGIDKVKERLQEIEKDRGFKPYNSDFWEGFYMADEIIHDYLGKE